MVMFRYLRLISPFSYAQKLTLLASVPLIVAATAIAVVVALQARALAEREIDLLDLAAVIALDDGSAHSDHQSSGRRLRQTGAGEG